MGAGFCYGESSAINHFRARPGRAGPYGVGSGQAGHRENMFLFNQDESLPGRAGPVGLGWAGRRENMFLFNQD